MNTSLPRRLAAPLASLALAALLGACATHDASQLVKQPAAPASAAASGVSALPPVQQMAGTRGYPLAVPRPVVNEYWGVPVHDDFEWLENAKDPYTRAWVAAENAYSHRVLDAIPARAALHQQLTELMSSTSQSYSNIVERGGVIFALKNAPPKQQPLLVTLKSVDDLSTEHVVYDPNAEAPDGSLEIDFFRPSLDGKHVAISVSKGGSEDGTLRVVDTATGEALPDRIPRVTYPTGGGDVAWAPGDAGLYYTQYPAPGSRPEADIHFYQRVFFHRLGTPADQDRPELGTEFPRIAETRLEESRDGRIVAAIVANGDGGDFSLYLKTTDANAQGTWRRIAADADGIKDVQVGDDDALYLLSRAGAPRGKVLRLAVNARTQKVNWARVPVVVRQSDGTIEHYAYAAGRVYSAELLGGPSRLREVDVRTRRAHVVALPPVSGIDQLAEVGRADVVAELTSFLSPPAWSHVSRGRAVRTAMVVTSEANFADCEVVREFATSRDGTKVPLNIIRRKSLHLDGKSPTILYGYGGYGVSMTPSFNPARRAWLDRGGVYVIANLRGGGEYGEAWHMAGNLTRKQNVFDDFIASAEFLVKQKYTRPDKLAIMGGSNGGLLMGAVLTQRPELFRAVVSSVGIYDMLRVELDPNGAFNTTEFGTVKDKAQFDALYAYSPLRNVRDGTDYPAILMLTGDNDGRVNPAHSRKMIARLQQADPSGRPILLRTSASSGHGIGTALSERIEETVDMYSFLVDQLTAGV
ncbi:MAG TPA: prolyl oligopeptidase family serine peptidase [Burkholderiaceae bacterium]